jgi:ComF family protein
MTLAQKSPHERCDSAALPMFAILAAKGGDEPMNLLDFVFPPRCVVCRSQGSWFCAGCRAEMRDRYTSLECRHGAPLTVCPRCLPEWTALDGVRVLGEYVVPLKTAIWSLKFSGQRQVAEPLGEMLAAMWRTPPLLPVEGVVAVPMPRQRKRRQGYDHAEELARAVSRRLGVPLLHGIRRTRAAPTQHTLSGQARRENVRDLFACTPRDTARIRGRAILIVDDVMTTGATLNAVAEALRRAGATHIYGAVLARPAMLDPWPDRLRNRAARGSMPQ